MMLHADREPPLIIKHTRARFSQPFFFPHHGRKEDKTQSGIIQNHSHQSVKGALK